MPAVPHKRKEEYLKEVSELGYLKCRPDKLTSQIYATLKTDNTNIWLSMLWQALHFYAQNRTNKQRISSV